jgi:hypothetical protein
VKLTDWLVVGMSGVGILLIPALGLLVRGTMKWTRTGDKLDALATTMVQAVTEMRQDHDSLDKRLRFMEEFWIRRGIWKTGDGQ